MDENLENVQIALVSTGTTNEQQTTAEANNTERTHTQINTDTQIHKFTHAQAFNIKKNASFIKK